MKTRKQTDRRYHIRSVKSGPVPVRKHQMHFWAKDSLSRPQRQEIKDLIYRHQEKNRDFQIADKRAMLRKWKPFSLANGMVYYMNQETLKGRVYDPATKRISRVVDIFEMSKDSDKDGVPDLVDCAPRDATRHGVGLSLASAGTTAVGSGMGSSIVGAGRSVLSGAIKGGAIIAGDVIEKEIEKREQKKKQSVPIQEVVKVQQVSTPQPVQRIIQAPAATHAIIPRTRRAKIPKSERLREKLATEQFKFELEQLRDEKREYRKAHPKKHRKKKRGFALFKV